MRLIQYITYPNGWFCVTNVSINIKNSSSMDALGIRSRVKYKTSPPQMFHAIFWESLPLTKFTHGLRHVNVTHHRRHRTRHTPRDNWFRSPNSSISCACHISSAEISGVSPNKHATKNPYEKKRSPGCNPNSLQIRKNHLDFFSE